VAIAPLSSVGHAVAGAEPLITTGTAPAGSFAHVLGDYLGEVGRQQALSQQAVQDIALGRTDNLHTAVLLVAKADLAFRLFLEIRNRLSDAYQEVMKMSV